MEINKPEKPLTVGINTKQHELRPVKTFSFERPDGSFIQVGEQEAWRIYSGKNQVIGFRYQPLKLIGASEGIKFSQAISEAHQLIGEGKLAEAKERLHQGEREELEEARLNPVAPRNFDTTDNRGNPVNINSLR